MNEFSRIATMPLIGLAFALSGCMGSPSTANNTLLPGISGAFKIAKPAATASPKPRLYVAEFSENKVLVFDPTVPSPTPEAVITKGLSGPFGLTVDRNSNLYVANLSNRSVTIYHPGKLTPSFTIDNGLGDVPESVAVDSKGNVFVSTFHHRGIVAFHPGHRHAYERFRLVKGTPYALAFDAHDNLFVADDQYVYEIPNGSTKPIDLGLSGLLEANGIAFANGILYVSNYTSNDVTVYKPGQKKPFMTITSGLDGPDYSTFVRPDELFVDNNIEWKIEGFKPRHTKPFVTITGLTRPVGIAAAPMQNP
jgi:hypothetical protein